MEFKNFAKKLFGRKFVHFAKYSVEHSFGMVFFWPKYNKIYKKLNKDTKGVKRLFIIGEPNWNDIGDQAIALAQRSLLNTTLKDYQIKGILSGDFYKERIALRKYIRKDDLIFLMGGGTMNYLYRWEGKTRAYVIRHFVKNKVLIFPQTFFFDLSNKTQKRYLEKANLIFRKNKQLTVFLREKSSFASFKAIFPTVNSLLVPDIVTFLDPKPYVKQGSKIISKEYAVLSLREDIEKQRNDSLDKFAKQELSSQKIDWLNKDILSVSYPKTPEDWTNNVSELFQLYSKAKFVLTDRLHGMIFSAILGIPCAAIDNATHKTEHTYEWLKDLPYIYLIKSKKDLELFLAKFLSSPKKTYVFPRTSFVNKFRPLIDSIEQAKNFYTEL